MIVVYCVHACVCACVCVCLCVCLCLRVCCCYAHVLWLRAASVRAARRAPAERHEASMEGRALVADLG